MKTNQIKIFAFAISLLISCIENVEPKYQEISGIWKLESAELHHKPFSNDSLLKYDMLDIPYHKFSNRKRANESIKHGLYIINDSTKNLGFLNKNFQSYKIRNNKDIEFQYENPDFGFPTRNVLTQIIFQGMWNYNVENEHLILIRHKLLSDTLGGLKLIYKKLK